MCIKSRSSSSLSPIGGPRDRGGKSPRFAPYHISAKRPREEEDKVSIKVNHGRKVILDDHDYDVRSTRTTTLATAQKKIKAVNNIDNDKGNNKKIVDINGTKVFIKTLLHSLDCRYDKLISYCNNIEQLIKVVQHYYHPWQHLLIYTHILQNCLEV